VQEAVTNIRTVASFGNEQILIGFLNERLKKPQSIIVKKSNIAGLSLGYSQLMMFAIYAIIFYVGALFHRDQDLPIKNMFTAIFAIMFASLGAGNNNQFMVDVGQAHNAAKNIFAILDAIDEVQEHESKVPKSQQITTAKISGEIEFRDVVFRYPSRERTVLNKISFKISPGQKAAFVGPSGCGKSTIMQLLLRFYEPQEGQIFLDGADITRYDLATLRSYFGVVSQEPVLFNATIRENIRYNAEGMDLEQIRKFAAQANALEFIERNNFEVVSAGKV
jgi:ATP-binding cassette subfamily B (MDR/TAP) protein 1